MVYDALVIGSGAAGYAAADRLFKAGLTNIAVVTEGRLCGTSRNTGSDKQTYYKLSSDGVAADCAYDMACEIFAAGSCDGELAYTEAVNSLRCFFTLKEYGVPFPEDEYGGFPGYRTDHDCARRASSVGPLTSKYMTECLEKKVLELNKTQLLDGFRAVRLLTDGGRCCGVLCLDKKTDEIKPLYARAVIAATGGPACVYASSVYPPSQHGMTGIFISAGAKLCNFAEWQYGLASTSFRWNVSGSYMQVVPRFVSIGGDGEECEFLTGHFANPEVLFGTVFRKGYEWPFSSERAGASSRLDMLVKEQTDSGRRVYLDYTKNPQGFSEDALPEDARGYLTSADAHGGTPYGRLMKLNPKAARLYKDHGIDLSREYLEIGVCAQHNNGGVLVDRHYQSSIAGLYVTGEAAGVFGITRPGGTALNSTQTGALAAAEHIAKHLPPAPGESEIPSAESLAAEYRELVSRVTPGEDEGSRLIPQKMSECAGIVRDIENCKSLLTEVDARLSENDTHAPSVNEYFSRRDMLMTSRSLLTTVINGSALTGSRGGALVISGGGTLPENEYYRDYLMITDGENVTFKKVSPVPKPDTVFEKLLGSDGETD